jgi:hypothetical protein
MTTSPNRLDETITVFKGLLRHVGESLGDPRRVFVAVRLGERGEPSKVDKGDGINAR